MAKAKVALLGASGFAGAELLRRLLRHPAADVLRVVAKDHVGENVAAAHPNLEGATDLVFQDLPAAEAVAGADVVMMGLPVAASLEVVAAAEQTGARIIDMSGAFRVPDAAAFERYYAAKHPRPELLGRFVYGLPELNREKIRAAPWVASPGCFATTIELGLLPLAEAGLLDGAIEVLGSERLTFGSNFPIEKLWTTYADVLSAHRAAVERHGGKAVADVFHDTADKVYQPV